MRAILDKGCEVLDLTLTDSQKAQLIDYVELLNKWNKVYNLTSVRDPEEMVTRHILDSLAILPYIKGQSLLDVGAGAGLPGIPLAIANPDLKVTLLDSNSKKTRFLLQAKTELGLDSVTVVRARVESANLEQQFDTVTARAFSTLNVLAEMAGQHCNDHGVLLLMKGTYPEKELQNIVGNFWVDDVLALDVPGNVGKRHLVRLQRKEG